MLDYRPALRERTGVGEFVHELARALTRGRRRDDRAPTLLSTSWKDRLTADARGRASYALVSSIGVSRCSRWRWAWNRLGWPPVEWLAGAC